MLEFVNSNGTFFTILGSIFTALISAIVAVLIDRRKYKADSIKDLREELSKTKQELDECKDIINEYKNIENQEKNIDKRTGAIYSELLPDGSKRDICGYCWEKERIKIPLAVEIQYDEYLHREYFNGYCYSCNTHCFENIETEFPSNLSNDLSNDISDEDLPF